MKLHSPEMTPLSEQRPIKTIAELFAAYKQMPHTVLHSSTGARPRRFRSGGAVDNCGGLPVGGACALAVERNHRVAHEKTLSRPKGPAQGTAKEDSQAPKVGG